MISKATERHRFGNLITPYADCVYQFLLILKWQSYNEKFQGTGLF